MNLDVILEEFIPHPPDAVWQQLTNAAAISDWLMPVAEFSPVVGARFRLKTEHLSPDGWVAAEVLELDPPRRMAWRWAGSDGFSSTVTFALTPEGAGTRIKLTHVDDA